MINKKILAASVAAICSFNASAVVDLDRAASALIYSSESVTAATPTKTIATNAALNLQFNFGQNLPVTGATDPLIRVAFTNATFTAIVDEGDFAAQQASAATTPFASAGALAGATVVFTGVSDGTIGGNFVVVSYENDLATTSTAEVTIDIATATSGLLVTDVTKPVTVTYSLYPSTDTTAALNGNGTPLYTKTLDVVTFATGQNRAGSFASTKNTALVAKSFKEFGSTSAVVAAAGADTGAVAGGKVASFGRVQHEAVLAASTVLGADSAAVASATAYVASGTATVTGDFSFGNWHMSALGTCATASAATNALVIDAAKTAATVPALNYTTGQSLCVTVDGVALIPRNADGYKVTTSSNTALSGTIGSIVYDTTNITVPYITSFSGYNQRVYILNNGSTDANYTTTFQTETGTTATAGTMSTGTVPAKTLLVINSVDMVTFEGTTRGAAVIEIEASTSAVESTTQTVNLSDGSTDTLTLAVSGS